MFAIPRRWHGLKRRTLENQNIARIAISNYLEPTWHYCSSTVLHKPKDPLNSRSNRNRTNKDWINSRRLPRSNYILRLPIPEMQEDEPIGVHKRLSFNKHQPLTFKKRLRRLYNQLKHLSQSQTQPMTMKSIQKGPQMN